MADAPLRFRWVRQLAGILAVVGLVGALALMGVGVVVAATSVAGSGGVASGLGLVLGGLVLSVLSLSTYGLTTLILKIESTASRLQTTLLDVEERVTAMTGPLRDIAANSQLSDAAKSVAHREKEREALRNAIREDILRQDWEAAYYLIEQMAERFGYREEADRIRREVDHSRQETIERMIVEAISRLGQLCDGRNWEQARTELDRLVRLFPNHERVRTAVGLVDRKRDEYKAGLLRAYNEALGRNDSERCIGLLKELDGFLTRNEAAAMAESARAVFRTQLHNMGVQFSLAVTEGRWRDALEVGVKLVDEYPNSRMAQEVRDKLDALQKRAGYTASAAAELIRQKSADATS